VMTVSAAAAAQPRRALLRLLEDGISERVEAEIPGSSAAWAVLVV